MKFGFGRHAEDGDQLQEGKGKETEKHDKAAHEHAKHHHYHETHVNVHTECGRHGDDWLFGGWSMGGVVKRVFSGERKG